MSKQKNNIILRLDSLETKLDNHLKTYDNHVVEFKARGRNHEENSRIMREFAEENNDLRTKVYTLETEQAIHKVVMGQTSDSIKSLQGEIKNQGDKLFTKISQIETVLSNNMARETTARWVIKVIVQAILFGCTVSAAVLGLLKFIG